MDWSEGSPERREGILMSSKLLGASLHSSQGILFLNWSFDERMFSNQLRGVYRPS